MTTGVNPLQAPWASRALAALRIVAGYLFIAHGTAKLFGAPHVAMFDGLQLFSLMGLAGVLEVVGGALLIVGLLTRPVAFVLSGFMAVAYFMAHASQGNALLPIGNGGELAVLYSFLFLFLSAAGGGAYALDNVLRDRKAPTVPTLEAYAGSVR
ncbi:MAG TPA: DoxX family protein [Casimicrobiaceae bacterium]|nr:DoxX family protein [Casimicrobiaceae bacterium]